MIFLPQHGVVVVVVVVVVVAVVVVVVSGRRGLTTMFPFHSNCLF